MLLINGDKTLITQIDQPGTSGKRKIRLPENERFRVRQIFEACEYAIPPQFVPSGRLTIVDVGANVGLFALYMKTVRSDSEIYCFEPVAESVTLLRENTLGLEGIFIHPCALSNHTGIDNIYLQPANSGENSLKPTSGSQDRAMAVEVLDAATAFQGIGLQYIDILKVDTEGSEIEILESLRQYLPYVGVVMAEYHSEADRRRIDGLLCDHLLFDARICTPQLGVVKYINSRLT